MTKKKRILIPIVGQGSIIHIIRTGLLERMRSFCDPVICMLWQQDDLINELRNKGFEVYLIPACKVNDEYTMVRKKIDTWYQHFILRSPRIMNNFLLSYKPVKYALQKKIKGFILLFKFRIFPSYITRLLKKEKILIGKQTSFSVYDKWVNDLQPEGLFTVTPFIQEVELIARLLRRKQLPVIASVHSFDNITKRGWPSIFFDHYLVWNKYNKAELERINSNLKTQNKVSVTGAPQFDFHFDNSYVWTKDEWLGRLGLPAGKKIILYAGGVKAWMPDEPQYLKHIVEAREKGLLPEDSIILFRCHPLEPVKRWKDYVGCSSFLFYDSRPENGNGRKPDQSNVSLDNIKRLVSTLEHSDVHVNICSTMTIDGSIFNKPVIGPYYDETRPKLAHLLRTVYRQEHYLPIMNSNVVQLADTKEKLIELLNAALNDPAQFTENCERCVQEIITYADGRSTDRVIAVLKTFFSK